MERLIEIALWGQDPETAQRTRTDWYSYLDDYRTNHSSLATALQVVCATVSHIRWRALSSSEITLVPAMLSMIAIAIFSTSVAFVDPSSSTLAADLHVSISSLLFMLALALKPWEIAHSKFLSITLILGGTGSLHLSLVIAGDPVVQTLVIIGHIFVGIGLLSGGIWGLCTKTAFGASRLPLTLLATGIAITVSANLLVILHTDEFIVGMTYGALSLAEIGFISQVPRMLEIAERTVAHRLQGHQAHIAQ